MQDVIAGAGECVVSAFFGGEYVVVGLSLKADGFQCGGQVGAKEADGVELIGVGLGSDPHEVEVIWHEDVGWTEKVLTYAGVKEEFANGGVEFFGEWKFGAIESCVCPENDGVGVIAGWVETWK